MERHELLTKPTGASPEAATDSLPDVSCAPSQPLAAADYIADAVAAAGVDAERPPSPLVPAAAAGLADDGWARLTEVDAETLRASGRVHLKLRKPGADPSLGRPRLVTLLRAGAGKGASLHAFDAGCYHAGGPLGIGDIEEVGEDRRKCVRCPWHQYLVDLETGRQWYHPMTQDEKGNYITSDEWKVSSKPMQRIHEAMERDGAVFVRLRLEGARESDHWARSEEIARQLEFNDT
mmetsp:Transcript_50267/g.132885  ORF Transcript_50267/g.132885 Transcript_50267/m.132885 type:complete len:235 (-) Transcript_50267:174-878(-)